MTRILMLAGEGEYESDRTMAGVADELRRQLPGVVVVYRTANLLEDMPAFPASSFGDLTALRDADLSSSTPASASSRTRRWRNSSAIWSAVALSWDCARRPRLP